MSTALSLTTRRSLLRLAALTAVPLFAARQSTAAGAAANLPPVVMWKDPNCQCCEGWAEHMRQAGFPVITTRTYDMTTIKRLRGVPDDLISCHTALIDGYTIEGHVPAQDILRLNTERPRAKGLASPGMPPAAPGMAGGTAEPYTVLLFGGPDGTRPFAQH
jgi:hypothetical protein